MKLEKRSSGDGDIPPIQEDKPTKSKPVVVYIMILFIAAFLLMALSFLMHQRSNTEALGELQNSVSAMQEVQASQERVIELQEDLADVKSQLDQAAAKAEAAEERSAAIQVERDKFERQSEALLALYQLQQHYSARELDACQELINQFETGLADSLPKEDGSGATPPAERYQELKEAVENKLEVQANG